MVFHHSHQYFNILFSRCLSTMYFLLLPALHLGVMIKSFLFFKEALLLIVQACAQHIPYTGHMGSRAKQDFGGVRVPAYGFKFQSEVNSFTARTPQSPWAFWGQVLQLCVDGGEDNRLEPQHSHPAAEWTLLWGCELYSFSLSSASWNLDQDTGNCKCNPW